MVTQFNAYMALHFHVSKSELKTLHRQRGCILSLVLPFIFHAYPSFNHLKTLFNESLYRLVPIKSQYEKAKNIKQIDAHIGRHEKYMVHPKLRVTSTNLLHHVNYFQKAGYNPGQLCSLHIFGLHCKNSSRSIPLSLPLGSMNSFSPEHKDTSLCSKHQDNHSPLSLRQNAVFISKFNINKCL